MFVFDSTYEMDEDLNARSQLLSTPPPSGGSVSGSRCVTPVMPSSPMTPEEKDSSCEDLLIVEPDMPVDGDNSQVTVVEQTWVPCYKIYTCTSSAYLATSAKIS